jgi:hypothetical protein
MMDWKLTLEHFIVLLEISPDFKLAFDGLNFSKERLEESLTKKIILFQ